MIIMFLITTLTLMNIAPENVSAFWNQDDGEYGSYRARTKIQIQLMHCNHKDTHYNNNGTHLNITDGDSVVNSITRSPRVNNDLPAGTATYDLNKYIYEYEMPYSEGQQVDYAVITTPNITHFEDPSANGVTETHGRMYWLGEYQNTMENLTATTGANEWYSFKEQTGAEVNNELSHQTWESVENVNNGAYKGAYVVSLDVSRTIDNGQKFLYLLEGTYMDKEIRDSNHPAEQDEGVPAYYGTHVYGILGIVFYRTVTFDSNGGIISEETIRNMKVYTGSSVCKIFPWYNDVSKEKWYSDIDVASPQVTTPYGTASVKAPSRVDYIFTGWYDTPSGGTLLYDTDGNAVKGTKYFDADGRWIYKGNVTAYANWEYIGNYTIRYAKGASDTYVLPPSEQAITVGTSAELKDTMLIGSRYTVNYMTDTNNSFSEAANVTPLTGSFDFAGWNIDGSIFQPGDTFYGENVTEGTVINAVAVYNDYTFKLPSAECAHYSFEGWYTDYDADTGTFGGYVGGTGDEYVLPTAPESYTRTLYARWTPTDTVLSFDYNVPAKAKKSPLGYVLRDADEKERRLAFGGIIGALPQPTLTGYTLTNWSWFKPSNNPVHEDAAYYMEKGGTAYALWTPKPYNIKYDYVSGEAVSKNPQSAEYYDAITVTAPTLKGAEFAGWDITGMDDSAHIADGIMTNANTLSGIGDGKTSVSLLGLNGSGDDVLLTARWDYISYNITYDFNGGSPSPDGSYPSSATAYELFEVSTPEKGSSVFKGWSVKGMDDGVHCVGGAYMTGSTAAGIGADKAADSRLPFSSLRYSAGTVTLTAAWEADDRQLTFIADTGSMSGDSIQDNWTTRFIRFGAGSFTRKKMYDITWGTDVPSASMMGYSFGGFFTEPDGGVQVFNGNFSKNIADRLVPGLYWSDRGTWIGPSLILYARFTPLEFEITFEPNKGVWTDDNSLSSRLLGVVYDSEKNSSVWENGSIARDGYIHFGWNTESDGGGYTVYDADGFCTDEGGFWSENYGR